MTTQAEQERRYQFTLSILNGNILSECRCLAPMAAVCELTDVSHVVSSFPALDSKRPVHEQVSAFRRHRFHSPFLLLALFTLHT